MMKSKTTTRFEQKRARLLELKKYMAPMMDTVLKREAIVFIKIFQDGIKNRTFRVKSLKQSTIDQKTKLGYSQPETPLYGKGFDDERSYINVLEIKKLKKGYKISPSNKKHHKSDLTLKELLLIHERGFTVKPKHGDAFHVPPRPILKKTSDLFNSKVKKLRQKEYKSIREAIKNFIKNKAINGITKIIRSIPSKIKNEA